ncbi:ABC transporter ATP-binding protein [Nocardiopsis ansamitocini]|uniref:ABC transporter ATP-binding protein n=1 Tax=Nocardiopsis ansamitocini TaxID=1670832 RepID=A0A9W6UJZ8_9ACTN|nr:ABC transporter ATP-binding protein [Nocardiopsis ansamitocini]
MLSARDLAKIYGEHVVFDGLCVDVAPGQRLGLVGENGVGKSTLLRLLAGVEDADAGTVVRPADTAFLHQEPPYPGSTTLGAVVEDALAEVRAIERELAERSAALDARPEEEAALSAYGAALDQAETREVWDADRRAAHVLAGLGLADRDPERTLDTLSGGERARLSLAALLVRRPKALVLDEPTNHLDDAAVAFLQDHLRATTGVLVLASHDRVFLDEVCTQILDLDPSREGRTFYGGAYSYYLREKRVERLRWEQQYRDEQDELVHLRQSVHDTARKVGQFRPMKDGNRMDYGGMGNAVQKQIARRVRNARQRLDTLERDQVAHPPRPLSFAAGLTGIPPEGAAVRVRDVEVPGRLVVPELDLPGSGRLLVTGPNGSGKSTLLHVLARTLRPVHGTVRWRRGVEVALLEQDVGFKRPEATPSGLFAAMTRTMDDPPDLAGLGLVARADLDRPVGALSVGQRRRVALALLVARAPQVLLLDEPTNHIALTLAEELEEALRSAPGSVVVATHDRWLRRGWDGPWLRLEQGRVVEPAA